MQTNIDRGSSAGEFGPAPLPQRNAGSSYISLLVLVIVVLLLTLTICPS